MAAAAILHPFGAWTTKTVRHDLSSVLVPLCSKQDDKFKLFTEACHKIMNTDTGLNNHMFNNLMFSVMNEDPTKMNDTLFNIISFETINFKQKIDAAIATHTFSYDLFTENYKAYYARTEKLKKNLWYYEKSIALKGSNGKSYSIVSLMRNYLFYANVINQKYNYDGSPLSMYSVFAKVLESDNVSIDRILPIFDMYMFYQRLSFIPAAAHRDQLFDLESDKAFMTNMGSNALFVRGLASKIDENIKKMLEIRTQKPNYEEVAEYMKLSEMIKAIMNMVVHFNEREMFNLYYESYLERRLLVQMNFRTKEQPKTGSDAISGTTGQSVSQDMALEREIIRMFKTPDDNKIVQSMFYKIADIEDSIKDQKMYEELHVSPTSAKYKNCQFDISPERRRMMNILTVRYSAWSDSKKVRDYLTYKIPAELEPLIDIFVAYYRLKYAHRVLKWNFNLGVAVISMDFGLNDDPSSGHKKYHFQVSTPQLFVLTQFNNKPRITAAELSQNTQIPLHILGSILNGFLMIKLLAHSDSNDESDPNIEFYINPEFTYPDSRVSLIPLMKHVNTGISEADKEVADKFAIGREEILKARIVRVMKLFNSEKGVAAVAMSYAQLFEEVKKECPFQPDDALFSKVLDAAIKGYFVRKVEGEQKDPTQVMYEYYDIGNESATSSSSLSSSSSAKPAQQQQQQQANEDEDDDDYHYDSSEEEDAPPPLESNDYVANAKMKAMTGTNTIFTTNMPVPVQAVEAAPKKFVIFTGTGNGGKSPLSKSAKKNAKKKAKRTGSKSKQSSDGSSSDEPIESVD